VALFMTNRLPRLLRVPGVIAALAGSAMMLRLLL
jgi:hypothetical protein